MDHFVINLGEIWPAELHAVGATLTTAYTESLSPLTGVPTLILVPLPPTKSVPHMAVSVTSYKENPSEKHADSLHDTQNASTSG